MDFKSEFNTDRAGNQIDPFSTASFLCGLLSVFLCCTGILSIPVAALGILFAVLTKRQGQPIPPVSVSGIFLSCLGMALGLSICIYAFYTVLKDPEMLNLIQEYYKGVSP
ncbi:MAG: hypothetical protein IJ794_16120 [Lachnospiraceae bacterium]|nr:hypothetical protein [Lachnospiraceae bacterium]